MRARIATWLVAIWAVSCATPKLEQAAARRQHGAPAAQDQEPGPASPASEPPQDPHYRHLVGMGTVLREPDQDWGVHLKVPVGIGLTSFDRNNISVEALTTIAVVPTFEFIVPLDENRRWTLLPFAGLGGAVQLGDRDLVGNDRWIGLLSAGAELMRWQPFAERYTSIVSGRARYDLALVDREGLLGDWGTFEVIGELRRAFGDARGAEPRFEAGIYAQGITYWDTLELEIDGVTPQSVRNQVELGVSLGASSRWEVLGLAVPRIYLGVRFEQDLQTFYIRFGRL